MKVIPYLPPTRSQAVCPSGFRFPKIASDNVDEWDWVKAFAKYSAADDPEHPTSWYIEYSSSPVMIWWMPMLNALGMHPYLGYETSTGLVFDGKRVENGSGSFYSQYTWYSSVKPATGNKFLGNTATKGGRATSHNQMAGNPLASWVTLAVDGVATSNWYYAIATDNIVKTAGSYASKYLARCIREDGTETP